MATQPKRRRRQVDEFARGEERRAIAGLRRAGCSLAECARKMGIGLQKAKELWGEVTEDLLDSQRLDARVFREMELDRLSALLRRAWVLANDGQVFNDKAFGRCLQIIEMRSKLLGLFGADVLAMFNQINIDCDHSAEAALAKFERLFQTVEKHLPAEQPALEGQLAAPILQEPDLDPVPDADLPEHVDIKAKLADAHADDRRKALRGAQVIDSRGGLTGTGQQDDDDRELDRPNWQRDLG